MKTKRQIVEDMNFYIKKALEERKMVEDIVQVGDYKIATERYDYFDGDKVNIFEALLSDFELSLFGIKNEVRKLEKEGYSLRTEDIENANDIGERLINFGEAISKTGEGIKNSSFAMTRENIYHPENICSFLRSMKNEAVKIYNVCCRLFSEN